MSESGPSISQNDCLFEQVVAGVGLVRLERWPAGLVFWAGHEIRWKSWETPTAGRLAALEERVAKLETVNNGA